MNEPLRFLCPRCQATIKSVKQLSEGATVTCPGCRHAFPYQSSGGSSPASQEPGSSQKPAPDPWDVDDESFDEGLPGETPSMDFLGDEQFEELDQYDEIPIEPRRDKIKKKGSKKKQKQRSTPADTLESRLLPQALLGLLFVGTLISAYFVVEWFFRPSRDNLPLEPPGTLNALFQQKATVKLDRNGHILGVSFSQLELSPERLKPLLDCPNLLSLTLYQCQFTSDDSLAIVTQKTTLQELTLWQTQGMTTLAPLEKLTHLKKLSLAGSRLSDLNLASFPDLESLKLRDQLDNLDQSLPRLKKLATIDYGMDRRMKSKTPGGMHGIGACETLRHLRLVDAFAAQMEPLAQSKNLESLTIEAFGFRSEPGTEFLRHLPNMRKLKTFRARNLGDLTSECITWLASAPTLQEVSIECRLGTARLEDFKAATALTTVALTFRESQGGTRPSTKMGPIKTVRDLYIDSRYLPVMVPAEWPALQSVVVDQYDINLVRQLAPFPGLRLLSPQRTGRR